MIICLGNFREQIYIATWTALQQIYDSFIHCLVLKPKYIPHGKAYKYQYTADFIIYHFAHPVKPLFDDFFARNFKKNFILSSFKNG